MIIHNGDERIDVPCRVPGSYSLKPILPRRIRQDDGSMKLAWPMRIDLFCRFCQIDAEKPHCIISGKPVSDHIAYHTDGRYREPPTTLPTKNPETKGERVRLNRGDYEEHIAKLRQVVSELDGMAPIRTITEMMGLDKCKTRTVYVWLCKLREEGFTKSEGESRFRVWGPTEKTAIGL